MAGKKSAPGQAANRESGIAAVTRWKNQDQLEFDIEFYDRILERNPDQVEVLRVQGELLSRRGLHRRALKVDQRLVELRPSDGVAHYNLACSLALLGYGEEALAELWHAFDMGYDDIIHLESDPDLEALRDLPGYHELLHAYGSLADSEDALDDEISDDLDEDELADDELSDDDFADLGELDIDTLLGFSKSSNDGDEFNDADFDDDDDDDVDFEQF